MKHNQQLEDISIEMISTVKQHIPDVDRFTIWKDGRWQFSTDSHNVPTFIDNIDISHLEELVYKIEDLVVFLPYSYQLA